jgi:hypothetical protein
MSDRPSTDATPPPFPPERPPSPAAPLGPEVRAVEPVPGGHDVHLFEEAGLSEARKPVPKWYWGVLIALSVFFVVYVIQNLTGVQPNSAR